MITDTGLSTSIYVTTKDAAKVAKGLYLGTTRSDGYADMEGTIEMKESDFHLMLGSLICLGLGTTQLVRLASVRSVFTRAGQSFVRLTSDEVGTLRQAVNQLSERAEVLAPMGRALIATVRGLLNMTVGEDSVMAVEDAIGQLSRQMRLAPAVIRARLESNAVVGPLIKGARLRNEISRIMGRPSFFRTAVEQEIISASVSVVTESAARGKHAYSDELPDVINDMLEGAVITFALVYFEAPTTDSLIRQKALPPAKPWA